MERREFFRTLGTAAAGVAAFSCDARREAQRIAGTSATGHADLQWSKAPCRYCGTGCGVEVGVHEGKVLAVRGDVASPVNRGLLCVKGYHLPSMLHGADRLLYPMRRNPDGKGLTRISWDDAIALIARNPS